MAKKGKHLSAATRQKISESVKRAQAARSVIATKVARADQVNAATDARLRAAKQAGSFIVFDGPAPLNSDGSTPRTSKEESAVQVAIDIVAMLRGEPIASATLVRVVDRILRP